MRASRPLAGLELRTLVAQGSSADVRLAYAALTDLLAEVGDDSITALPTPQRRALEAALLRNVPTARTPPDPRAVATGLLTLVKQLAEETPLLLAIDDLQWLDSSSARALRFAVRRLSGRTGLLAARRDPPRTPPSEQLWLAQPEALRVIRLAPLARGEVHRLLRERTGRSLPPPALARIDHVAAGNPFVALELARAHGRDGDAEPLALTESLRELVAARLSALAPDVRAALLLAAALTRPRVAVIQAALETGDAGELLGPAEAAQIVTIGGGEVSFIHPLLASGVYAGASAPERRAAHRRLAAVVEGTEERARHLALASAQAEPEVIAALDAAAAEARRRGAPVDAAELLGLAFALGADEPRRLIDAGECHLASGDLREAGVLAERAAAALGPGPERARALGLLGVVRARTYSYAEAAVLLEQARAEAPPGEPRAVLALTLSYVLANTERLPEAVGHASAAVEEAASLGEPGLLAETLAVRTMVRCLVGEGIDETSLARALELEDPERPTPIMLTPTLIAGLLYGWTGRFEESLPALDRARRRCLEQGAEGELVHMTKFMAMIHCGAGELDRARELVAEVTERAAQLGTHADRAIALGNQAFVSGWVGDADEARRCAHESLALYESIGARGEALMVVEALGPLELALERYEAAAEVLVPALEGLLMMGGGEPAAPPFSPDAIEALVALGRLDEARRHVTWLGERAEALGRPQVIALAARCRGLLLAADGELEAAEDALVGALAAHDRQPIAYDRARSLLALARVQRRRRRRRAARESLEQARAIFERLHATSWVNRCEAELGRIGRRGSPDDEGLSPSEQRVAELAASGLTNRAMAAAISASPKTIEAHLARIYRKLGIGSRAELGRLAAEGRLGFESSRGDDEDV